MLHFFLSALVFQKPEELVPNDFQGLSSSSSLGFWGPGDEVMVELLEMVPTGQRWDLGGSQLEAQFWVPDMG